jgi:hypothetical protein
MIRSDKKYKDLESLLNKKNNLMISDAIELLRVEIPFEGAIKLLVKLYDKTDDHEIKKSIEGFIIDLKDQSASIEIIDEIKKEWKVETINMLVSSCWQSGLDYSNYSTDLARAFLKGNYITAFECLTVIEEFVSELSRKEKDEILSVFEETPLPSSHEKNVLLQELFAILKK